MVGALIVVADVLTQSFSKKLHMVNIVCTKGGKKVSLGILG